MSTHVVSKNLCFGGQQLVLRHASSSTNTTMKLGLFLPPAVEAGPVPVLVFLSGLTCSEQNVVTKAGYQRMAAQLGLAIVAPDTSPRGDEVADDDGWDLGQGASFYLDATESPWNEHYAMESYIVQDLMSVLKGFPIDLGRMGVTGHSMGGHGALTLAFKHPQMFRSVSAFSPVVSSTRCPWGVNALQSYLGDDTGQWAEHDACLLLKNQGWHGDILVDQGQADGFLDGQLKSHLLAQAAEAAGVSLTLRMQPGYDHSYYFVSTFIGDHLTWHAERL